MGESRELLYWDPVPHVTAVLGTQSRDGSPTGPNAMFGGKWEDRNWRNVSGPVVRRNDGQLLGGRLHAPRHILYGDAGVDCAA